MAITHVKVTYSVQPGTAQRVQELATKWGVPKSEVIRRVVEDAAKTEAIAPRLTPLQALEELMSTASPLTDGEVARWQRRFGCRDAPRAASAVSNWNRRGRNIKKGVQNPG